MTPTEDVDAVAGSSGTGPRDASTDHDAGGLDELVALFGRAATPREDALWSLMGEGQRERALRRARAVTAWADGQGTIASAKLAAAEAGVTLVRFYQMNKQWREGRSLDALGIGAAPERGRRSQFSPEVNGVLQSVVADLASDERASVRSLALRLAATAMERGVAAADLPGHNTLRAIVERARRDRLRRGEAGNALVLDHAACGIVRLDGSPWVVFVVVDVASQLILGAAPGDPVASDAGYRDAARDAIRRLDGSDIPAMRWAPRLASVQIVPGPGSGAWLDLILTEGRAASIGVNLTAERKAGRYLEEIVGRAIGVLPIWPARVGAASLPPWASDRAPAMEPEAATARIALAVDDHNAKLTGGRASDAGGPPSDLTQLLRAIAGAG